MKRRAVVVDGPLAFRMRRLAAARDRELGLEILTLPQLAVRLAGGFCRPAHGEILFPAINAALEQGGYAQLNGVRHLPGMARAVARTLARVWSADLNLDDLSVTSTRLSDLALLQRRIREALPAGALIPTDLRDAALARCSHANSLFGSLTLEGLMDIDPVWRSLVAGLASQIDVEWISVGLGDRTWFPGRSTARSVPSPPELHGAICADPRAEVVEALRWARELLSRGDIAASDIAFSSASPDAWDEHFLVLAADAGLPLHFSHGIPALSTREGQACAALADVLINGLSQDRVRRLLRRLPRSPARDRVPDDWSAGLPRRAGLFALDHWRRALAATRDSRTAGEAAEVALSPILEAISKGPAAATQAGDMLLVDQSRLLWEEALRIAPEGAIALSLQALRLPDGRDPGNCIVWCPASHLSSRPRPWLRLLGIASRSWPRTESEDPLLPDHILPRRVLEPVSLPDRDRRLFQALVGQASRGIVLSRSRRSAAGSLQSPSPLWPDPVAGEVLGRTRIPEHAFSESDRLLARPLEAAQSVRVASSRLCWRNWGRPAITPHDGAVRPTHPTVERALGRLHSTTSLRRLLRDPLGFLWRYGLGWRSLELDQQPLAFSPATFGELVHELLRRAINSLEPEPGFGRASRAEIEVALEAAVGVVSDAWPLERAVPPSLLWRHTLDEAARRTLRGLTLDDAFQAGTRSWTELSFGQSGLAERIDAPWEAGREVQIPNTGVHFGGRIDRVDLRAGGAAVRISDYKAGEAPRNAHRIIIAQGSELQRVLYALAARQLLPDATMVVSRLVYLDGTSDPFALKEQALDDAISEVAKFVTIACRLGRSGSAAPGPDARDRFNDLRLALPADLEAYFQRKQAAFNQASSELSPLWSRP